LEWGLSLGAKTIDDANSGSIIGKGLSGLFGFGSTSTTAKDSHESTAPGEEKVIVNYVTPDQLLHAKISLGPIKLRFAYLLADLGYTSEAYNYAISIKDLSSMVELAASKPSHKTGSDGPIRPFKKKFVADLDDFIERLQIFEGKMKPNCMGKVSQMGSKTSTSESKGADQSSASGSSIPSQGNVGGAYNSVQTSHAVRNDSQGNWGIGSFVNVLSSSTLKDLVDGAPEQNPPNPSLNYSTPNNPVSMRNLYQPSPYMPPAHTSQTHVPLSSQPPVPGNVLPYTPNPANNKPFLPPQMQGLSRPGVSSQPNNPVRLPPTDQAPVPKIGKGFTPSSSQTDFQAPAISNPAPSTLQSPPLVLAQSAAAKPSIPVSSDISLNNSAQTVVSPTVSSDKPAMSPQKSDKPASKANQGTPSQETASAPQTGFFGLLKKNIISFMNPDAHLADDNLGNTVDAVYDKLKGRWVFPGEVSQMFVMTRTNISTACSLP